jgi:cell division protein FtsQ
VRLRRDRELRTRRRFARRQWARRWVTWKWLVALLLVVAVAAFGVWLLWFSTVLTAKHVTVTGTGYLSADDIREAAAIPADEQLVRLDVGDVRNRVAALAPVRGVQVRRVWPDRVRIAVRERVAVAVVDIGGRIRGVDADGVVFRDYPSKPRDLPLVQAGTATRDEAIAESAQVVSAMPPSLARRVDHVEVRTVDQITLVLRDGRSVHWGSAEDSEEKARVLEALLRQRPAKAYDVSVPGRPTSSG